MAAGFFASTWCTKAWSTPRGIGTCRSAPHLGNADGKPDRSGGIVQRLRDGLAGTAETAAGADAPDAGLIVAGCIQKDGKWARGQSLLQGTIFGRGQGVLVAVGGLRSARGGIGSVGGMYGSVVGVERLVVVHGMGLPWRVTAREVEGH